MALRSIGRILYECSDEPGVDEVVIPDNIYEIAENAFAHCPGVKRVILPRGLERIERFEIDIAPELKVSDKAFSLTVLPAEVRQALSGHFCKMADDPLFPFY